MKAVEFDEKFDENLDILDNIDLNSIRKVNIAQKRINLDLPKWMIDKLDNEAEKIGVTRQSMIKIWLSEKLDFNRV